MNEEHETKRNIFDITQYSERTRKIIFGVVVFILLAIIALAIFVVSPKNDEAIASSDSSPIPTATQAAVDNETNKTGKEAVASSDDVALRDNNNTVPTDETEAAKLAQQKIIDESLAREKAQTDKVVEDTHAEIPNADALKTVASKGMLEYCTNNPDETKEQKQERMKPYFHSDNSDYASPQGLAYLTKCSVEAVTEPAHENSEDVIVYVGIAWGSQSKQDGPADTGYTQYRVVVDNNGIVSFDD